MKIFFINPPFKSEYGKFSRESRSPAVTKSGALYYPLWLIYAAAYAEKQGFEIDFLDAPAKQWNEKQSLEYIVENGKKAGLFVIDTSTPSIYSDVAFSEKIKEKSPLPSASADARGNLWLGLCLFPNKLLAYCLIFFLLLGKYIFLIGHTYIYTFLFLERYINQYSG